MTPNPESSPQFDPEPINANEGEPNKSELVMGQISETVRNALNNHWIEWQYGESSQDTDNEEKGKLSESIERVLDGDYSTLDHLQKEGLDRVVAIKKSLLKIEQLVEQNPLLVDKMNVSTDELKPSELQTQLNMRHQIIQLFNVMIQSGDDRFGETDDFIKLDIHHMEKEGAIQYGSYLVAPGAQTNDFFKLFKIFDEPSKLRYTRENTGEGLDGVKDQHKLDFFQSFWKENNGWEGRNVLEFGGWATARKMQDIGAETDVIDAGHTGYRIGYRVENPSAMIDLTNYQENKQLGMYDMICSANTLDWESGIEGMADYPKWIDEPEGPSKWSKGTIMAEDELALIFYSQLRKGGYMVHDEMGLPDDLCELIGIQKTYKLNLSKFLDDEGQTGSTWSDERLHIYQKVGQPSVHTVVIGNKIATYNEETDSWELSGSRDSNARETILSAQEFIFSAKRDIELNEQYADLAKEGVEGRERLLDDGFKIDCGPDDIEALLELVDLNKLTKALSEKSRGNLELWQSFFNNATSDQEREGIMKNVPETLRTQLT